MSQDSAIEWTDATWNPVTGCSKVSPGCKNCYAERMARRLLAMGQHRYRNGFEVTLHRDILDAPLAWRRPKRIFVNSMSDLFHEDVPDRFILDAFGTMSDAHWHSFQILTKRSDRMLQIAGRIAWPSNVWMGVSVESRDFTHRVGDLQRVPAKVKFVSAEPLIGPIPNLPLTDIDWVIVGGESGPGARLVDASWARGIRDQCLRHGVAFFFKQWGGARKSKAGRALDGRTWDEYPRPLRGISTG